MAMLNCKKTEKQARYVTGEEEMGIGEKPTASVTVFLLTHMTSRSMS